MKDVQIPLWTEKIFNFISAFGLASFPVTLMTPETQ